MLIFDLPWKEKILVPYNHLKLSIYVAIIKEVKMTTLGFLGKKIGWHLSVKDKIFFRHKIVNYFSYPQFAF